MRFTISNLPDKSPEGILSLGSADEKYCSQCSVAV
jgi:hypothetical protein